MSRDLLLSLKPTLASVVRSTQYWPKDRLKNTSAIYLDIFSLKKLNDYESISKVRSTPYWPTKRLKNHLLDLPQFFNLKKMALS